MGLRDRPDCPNNIFKIRAEATGPVRIPSVSGDRPPDPVARSLLSALDAEESFEPIEDGKSDNPKKRKKPPLGATPCRKQTRSRPAHPGTMEWQRHHPCARHLPLTSLSVAFGGLGFNPPPPCAPSHDATDRESSGGRAGLPAFAEPR